MDLTGTQSEKNLRAALAGESIARNKYTFFSMVARAEGHTEIADAFERLSLNEMQHAKLWFQYLNGPSKTTAENLKTAMSGEFDEWSQMYPDFAKKAREEGLEDLAKKFEAVCAIERDHEMQFMRLFAQLHAAKNPTEPPVEEPKELKTYDGYRCVFCGAVFDHRPDVCNVCQAIGSFEACKYQK